MDYWFAVVSCFVMHLSHNAFKWKCLLKSMYTIKMVLQIGWGIDNENTKFD